MVFTFNFGKSDRFRLLLSWFWPEFSFSLKKLSPNNFRAQLFCFGIF